MSAITSSAPSLSAVIVSYNESASLVADSADALRTRLPEAEIVLVDNGTANTRLAQVAASLPNSQLIAGHGNVGYARGNNIGVRAAKGTHVLIMNPDTRIVAIDTQALGRVLAEEPFGLRGPLHIDEDGTHRFHIAPGRSWLDEFVRDHLWGLLMPRQWPLRRAWWSEGRQAKYPWVGGSIFLAQRDEFLRLGGFDERFFIYYEDRELSDRYRCAGLPIRADAAVVAAHFGGGAFRDEDTNIRGLTWAVLAWLQYIYLHDGPVAARAARRLLLGTYRVMGGALLVVSSLSTRRLERVRRKGRQLLTLRQSVTSPVLPEAARDCYPDARGLNRRPIR